MNCLSFFSKKNPSISKKTINEIEKELGFKLPEEYVQLLVQTNGGTLKKTNFSVNYNDEVDCFKEIELSIETFKQAKFSEEFMEEFGVPKFSDKLFPIFDTPRTDLSIAIGYDGIFKDKIYLWAWGFSDGERTADEIVKPIANSILEFLAMLK